MRRRGLVLRDKEVFQGLLELHAVSLRGLAREVGVDHSHLVRVVAGTRGVTAARAGAICAVLRVPPSTLWASQVERERVVVSVERSEEGTEEGSEERIDEQSVERSEVLRMLVAAAPVNEAALSEAARVVAAIRKRRAAERNA